MAAMLPHCAVTQMDEAESGGGLWYVAHAACAPVPSALDTHQQPDGLFVVSAPPGPLPPDPVLNVCVHLETRM